MARKKGVPCWRGAFLRALGRTGNVTLSARIAGVDKSTAYQARRRDAGFAGKWAAAVAAGKARAEEAPPPRFTRSPSSGRIIPRTILGHAGHGQPDDPANAGEELVLRVSKRSGRQLIKASAGRWSGRKEALFLEALRRTGCVKSAAFACGLSTTALYRRRKADDDLREKWVAAAQEADDRLPGLLTAAAIAALDPEIDEADLPPCSVREAIHICKMKGLGTPAARQRVAARNGPRVATNAEVREALEKSLKAFSGRVHAEKIAQGWTETDEGQLIPPGWVYVGTPDADTPALPAPEEREPRIVEL